LFKKVSALVLMLGMLLVGAPLVLAQVPGVQYTSQSQLPQVAQQNAGQNQPPQSGQQPTSQNQLPQPEPQTTSQDQPAQSGQQNAGQNQPPQSPISSLKDLTELDANNNLVVNCGALIERLAHFQQIGKDTIANDPNLQLEMMQATDLAQLCTADGFTNNGQPSSTTPTNGGQQPSNTTPT
jgi:hypothetical protein